MHDGVVTHSAALELRSGEQTFDLPDLRYGETIQLSARARNSTAALGTCFCEMKFTSGAQRAPLFARGQEVTGGARQFFGDGWKDYVYRFVVPQGVDAGTLRIHTVEDFQGVLELADLTVSRSQALWPPVPARRAVTFVAHLGMIGYAPPNTMAAFHLARRAGFPECVLNTNHTSDGHLVALHNDTIDATSNGTGCVHDMTLEALRRYDYGSWFHPVYAGAPLPLVSEVLGFMARAGMRPVLRLSSHFHGEKRWCLEKLWDLVRQAGLAGRCTAKAFSFEALQELADIAGDRLRYGYCKYSPPSEEEMERLRSLESDVYFDLRHTRVEPGSVAAILERGIAVESWIVNDFQRIVEFIGLGINGFTTDFYNLDGCLY